MGFNMQKYIAVADYGAGNLFSVKGALDSLNIKYVFSSNPDDINNADGVILPGVGAFIENKRRLDECGLSSAIKNAAKEKPLLGICLGMQFLFDKSYEFGECDGLSLIKGEVVKINSNGFKIPHMGWNILIKQQENPLLYNIQDSEYVYFVHSYRANTDEKYIAAYTEYSEKIPALVCNNNVYGAQFHPEKSGKVGIKILQNFYRLLK
jgi:imidazole glycerol-phosphate synthase subunit HisH